MYKLLKPKNHILIIISSVSLLLSHSKLCGQERRLEFQDVITIALQNNQEVVAHSIKIEEQKKLMGSAFAQEKTDFTYSFDQNNVAENNHPLRVFGIAQTFKFPTLYISQYRSRKISINIAKIELEIEKNKLINSLSEIFFGHQMLLEKRQVYHTLDSLYSKLLNNAERKVLKGEISKLEALNIKAKGEQYSLLLNALDLEINSSYKRLKTLMNYDDDFIISPHLSPISSTEISIDSLPIIRLLNLESDYNKSLISIEKNSSLPEISLNYFLGYNNFEKSKYYHGFQIGLSIPIFFGGYSSKIGAANLSYRRQSLTAKAEIRLVISKLNTLTNDLTRYRALIEHYQVSGKELKNEIMRTSIKLFEIGEIDFYKFINSYETALFIELEYLENIFKYNKTSLAIQYYSR